jgi:glycosyltransferase involved in cell wall biosynthesis
MNVGIILAPFGIKNPSGLSAYVLNLTLALVNKNQHWHFTIFIKGVHDVSMFSTYSNVTIVFLPVTFLWKDIAYSKHKAVDVWLYNNPNMPFFVTPKKSVLTALDFGAFYPDTELSLRERIEILFSKFLQYTALQKVTHVLCTSYATKDDLHRLFPSINKAKVTVAMCGFTRVCEQYVGAVIQDLPRDYYLVVGVIKPRKNQLTAVQAFIAGKEQGLTGKLIICGKGKGEYFDSLMRTIETSKYKDEIIYFGYCSNEELVTLYKHARALVFPSHVEGFGMPIMEAMSCGTPVITSSNGALGEAAGDAALTVDSRDVVGFMHAMQQFENDSVRQHYIKKGPERSLEFSWEKSADVYTATLQKVATL